MRPEYDAIVTGRRWLTMRLDGHVRSAGAQLLQHRIQVADPEVQHDLLGAGPEVGGPGLERREHRRPGSLTPQAVLIRVQAQAIATPPAQGRRVGGPQEVPADSKHTFHAAILPALRPDRRAPHHRLLHPHGPPGQNLNMALLQAWSPAGLVTSGGATWCDPSCGILAIMPELIEEPTRVAAVGQPPKLIDE